MKTIITLIYFILLTNLSFAQNAEKHTVDSLKIELKYAKEDTIKVEILNRLSSKTYYIDSSESLKYAQSASQLANTLSWDKGIADSYANIGLSYWVSSHYSKALEYTYKSLKIHESLNDKVGMASSFNTLGVISVDDKKYSKGLTYYNAALKLSLQSNGKKMTSLYLNNIGDVYLQQKKYTDALNYFYQALQLNKEKKDSTRIAFNLTNLGITYNSLKQYSKGISYINQSIQIYKNDKSLYNGYNKFELGRTYYFMSLAEESYDIRQNLLDQSIQFFNESIAIFKRFKASNDLQLSYSFISKVYKEKGNQKEALNYYEKSYTLKTSIFSAENKKQINDLVTQREIDLRDKQIIIQNLKIKGDSRKVYMLITMTSAIVIFLGLFFWLYVSKRKTNEELKEKNKTISNISKQKDKFFSIIAHDLRGPFNGFLGLTELLTEDLETMNKEETQYATTSIMSSANNLNKLLENLLEWSRMEQGLIPFEPEEILLLPITEECIDTIRDKATVKNIKITTNIHKNTIIFADTNILQAVIRNIISNAVKFTPKNGEMHIQSIEEKDKVTISVKDSGIGMTPKMLKNLFRLDVQTNRKGTDNEPSTGLGLILCKEFIEKHGGSIWVESEENKGSTFSFSFPKMKNNNLKMAIDFTI